MKPVAAQSAPQVSNIVTPKNVTTNEVKKEIKPVIETPKQPKITIKGLPKLAHSISTKLDSAPITMPIEHEKDRILSEEEFKKYWNQTLDELVKTMPELKSLFNGVNIVWGENNEFELEASNGYFEIEFKKYKLALLTKLRDNSGVRGLNCKVKIVRAAQSAVIYNPADKYADMLKRNPKLVELRKLFTSLDY